MDSINIKHLANGGIHFRIRIHMNVISDQAIFAIDKEGQPSRFAFKIPLQIGGISDSKYQQWHWRFNNEFNYSKDFFNSSHK